MFQCSSASRKFLNARIAHFPVKAISVSVLFSEPKIPQSKKPISCLLFDASFSALQRAENSSMPQVLREIPQTLRFSALQRAENSSMPRTTPASCLNRQRFSALQRAENSSIIQKNRSGCTHVQRFSALQRAENSSIPITTCRRIKPV